MKTLDEVIACLDGCGHIDCDDCPYHYEDEKIEVDDCAQSYKDALYYLKEYRWVVENCAEALAEKYPSENVPLTWDELKTMTGKPVWIEIKKKPSLNGWRLIRSFNGAFMTTLAATCYQREFNYKTMGTEFGKTWQAYRKERR